ncbi:hypothetical protein OV208_06265 [Corallococcus sp. bb12-1]|uniref:hypothetical protein n=1 Tax=Corallococcus sp. bb12-1 TaxID=2996784 RepID=UPI00226E792D|nr:hypothetical protein [Corallococcus sp. bb12-1]MCY1040921.1 hypothetical protein [Corallococcus sp. bb12-1]
MSKHQLIISKYVHQDRPVRSLGGKLLAATELVFNSTRSEEALDDPRLCLVVPGDVLEIVVASGLPEGAGLWLLEANNVESGGLNLDIDVEVMLLPVDTVFAPGPGEQRRKLWISERGQEPRIPPDDGTGNTGSMVATPPPP